MRKTLVSAMFLVLMTITAGSVFAATNSMVEDVFGIKVGKLFTLPDCTASKADTLCIFSAYMSREAGEEAFTPVHVPSKSLPSYVDPRSVRICVHEGKVLIVRYSILDKPSGQNGLDLSHDLTSKYGGQDVFTQEAVTVPDWTTPSHIRTVSIHVQWDLPEVIVTLNAKDLSGIGFATVEVYAQTTPPPKPVQLKGDDEDE